MTDNLSDLVLEGNAAVTLLQEFFACDITIARTQMRGMRLYRRCRLFASSLCGSNGSSSKMFPLRWHSHEGSPYTARSVARIERRALPKILVVYMRHSCYDDCSLLELG